MDSCIVDDLGGGSEESQWWRIDKCLLSPRKSTKKESKVQSIFSSHHFPCSQKNTISIIWKRNLLNIRIIADKIRRICILITIKIYGQKHFSWCFIQLNDIKIKCIINKKSVFTTFFLRFLLFWPNKTVGFFGIFWPFLFGLSKFIEFFCEIRWHISWD